MSTDSAMTEEQLRLQREREAESRLTATGKAAVASAAERRPTQAASRLRR